MWPQFQTGNESVVTDIKLIISDWNQSVNTCWDTRMVCILYCFIKARLNHFHFSISPVKWFCFVLQWKSFRLKQDADKVEDNIQGFFSFFLLFFFPFLQSLESYQFPGSKSAWGREVLWVSACSGAENLTKSALEVYRCSEKTPQILILKW